MRVYSYRIYEISEEKHMTFLGGEIGRTLFDYGFLIADDKDVFKSMIKDMYPEIYFARSKKMPLGTLYCVVIHDSDVEMTQTHHLFTFQCDNCNKELTVEKIYKNHNLHDTKHYGLSVSNQLKTYNYCCDECKEKHRKQLEEELKEANDGIYIDKWISKESFSKWDCGFIYKISKKSTGEFYIGQTRYVPIFRWGQHLLSDRFPMSKITDYIFEVLETCKHNQLNTLEAFYINKYKDDPLNINKAVPVYKGEQLDL